MTQKSDFFRTWTEALPELSKFSQGKYYMVFKPFVFGLELVRQPRSDNYSPYFDLYGFYGNTRGSDIKACLEWPVVHFEILSKRGLQYKISLDDDGRLINDAASQVRNVVRRGSRFEDSLGTLERIFDSQLKTKLVKATLQQPKLWQAKYYNALLNSPNKSEKILKGLRKDALNWDMIRFEKGYGRFEEWYDHLKNTDIDSLLRVVDENMQDRRIHKLPQAFLSAQ
ncbi:hypothetical protein [Phaeocystidibacter luteus]|uniref:DUF4304 domain-containing protein n=1 Tax=Phaeocystidibacter luteus TaxID=911197 RepID=A0A6N6RF18_9FLAO|nr:hypothetical protein [Phaeocystidibacter luteus]KAB2807669.1 hypothetical protein F8C67_11555 [Phaeocystidibacter luteus]